MQRTRPLSLWLTCLVLCLPFSLLAAESNQEWEKQARAYLKSILYTRAQLADWISGGASLGEAYDGRLGWLLADRRVKHGVDGSIGCPPHHHVRRQPLSDQHVRRQFHSL